MMARFAVSRSPRRIRTGATGRARQQSGGVAPQQQARLDMERLPGSPFIDHLPERHANLVAPAACARKKAFEPSPLEGDDALFPQSDDLRAPPRNIRLGPRQAWTWRVEQVAAGHGRGEDALGMERQKVGDHEAAERQYTTPTH